jgi:3alpha(or 20beta)-hydroxysteroid dehydrogenase
MMGRLSGKVALITGAARGQGAEEARLFVAEGARVAIADIREAEGRALAEGLGEHALFVPLDVTEEASWRHAVETVLAAFGRLDILVNNAGVFLRRPLAETSVEEIVDVFRVNQLGVLLGMKTVFPAMRDAGGGSIVNISSVAGLRGAPNTAAYTASKHAVRGATKVAALEFSPHRIRVNSVHPGLIDTDMVREKLEPAFMDGLAAAIPQQRFGTSRDVASMVLFVASDEAAYSTGCEFVCDGGSLTGNFPA